MVSKFKSLSALEKILDRGQFWETSQLWRRFQLERRFGPGNYPSTRFFFFLDFLLFFFYIVFFLLSCIYVFY